jgi:hypothetical protein
VEGADKVPRDRMQADAERQLRLDVGHHRLEHVFHGVMRGGFAE